ncbi:organic hydroperoxide resistance protein [Agrobacterium tumefaciens]|uniref:organic hydroperoxide resistance protein n=1 Tax=Agrobacterium tumefaciens TaxID=358 RepID=UPI00287EA92B|nr:organic hydroperoxide resistance protein [Agrobacterium tumefaciens]MDS7593956.1 organic hydroperoxide resistance protein [Agrobacterium tumefaciens]
MKPEKILYQAEVRAFGGRDGRAESKDGSFQLRLDVPKELGGPGGAGSNPEQLFAAGYAACFLGAVKLVARTRKIALPDDVSVSALVGIGPVAVGYALAVELIVELPGIENSIAHEIVSGAHERCPYSNATRGNIDVKLTIA